MHCRLVSFFVGYISNVARFPSQKSCKALVVVVVSTYQLFASREDFLSTTVVVVVVASHERSLSVWMDADDFSELSINYEHVEGLRGEGREWRRPRCSQTTYFHCYQYTLFTAWLVEFLVRGRHLIRPPAQPIRAVVLQPVYRIVLIGLTLIETFPITSAAERSLSGGGGIIAPPSLPHVNQRSGVGQHEEDSDDIHII